MSEHQLVTLTTAKNTIEANLMKSKLESQGIRCFIADENLFSLYSNALGGVRVQVPAGDLQAARKILQLTALKLVDPK